MIPSEFIALLNQERASAILRTKDPKKAHLAMEAAIRGGFKIIEFTYSIPEALTLIKEFSALPGIVVGAGTVLSIEDARNAVEVGARYLVSPVMDEIIIKEAKSLGVAAMPGCSTPTEMLKAHRAGAALQKLFPGAGTGPAFVQQTLGPLPFLRIVPTSGVTLENAADYLRAGSFAVGFVNSLFNPSEIEAEDFEGIEHRAKSMIDAVAPFKKL
ncbi:MAG: bifunctional 4-hydroxy-2-oxoglutarate aldolase/2-dehydro-3-deoxy-phosphogluconate aldolase [Verrucomicrobia bacterium]|nr:bifunctional 4-hydroxy-2-oxoglutarate aldolase/2-dehydro-3-deoxy-phosphogluconate aldolase [Verrucomicrobiota bacterium]